MDRGLRLRQGVFYDGERARVAWKVGPHIGSDAEALSPKLEGEARVSLLHVARGLCEVDGPPVRRRDRTVRRRRRCEGCARRDAVDAFLQKSRELVAPVVELAVRFSAVEKRRDVADPVRFIARVEEKALLAPQLKGPPQPVDMTLADDDHALLDVRDAALLAQRGERLELLHAIGTLHPIVRHDDEQ